MDSNSSKADGYGTVSFGKNTGPLGDAALEADTTLRSASNFVTGGLADRAEAAFDATVGLGGPGDWQSRYEAGLRHQAARNVYDNYNRGIARGLGVVGGAALLARGGYGRAVDWSSSLPSVAKGKLGEALSVMKTIASRETPAEFQVRKPLSQGATRADHLTTNGTYVEAKFGPSARPSPRQLQAADELGAAYRFDRWLPHDVGLVAGTGAAIGGLLGNRFLDYLGARKQDTRRPEEK